MANIDMIVREINRELGPQFEERLRVALADRDREWLIDQIIRLTLDAHGIEAHDREVEREAKDLARTARLRRVREIGLDRLSLQAFIDEHFDTDRAALQASGHLRGSAPVKGTSVITGVHRTPAGDELLEHAKDVLFALLFGDDSTRTELTRVQQELLTVAVPRDKAAALDFMRASTELAAAGTWQDPDSVSNDERADNVLLEVQYGDTVDELVGNGIVRALSLINNLEINEQVLYARMIDLEETTLIT